MSDTRTPAPASADAMDIAVEMSKLVSGICPFDIETAARLIQQYGDQREAAGRRRGIEAVGRGEEPDARVGSEIAYDLVELSTRQRETEYKSFWINGSADPVRFNEEYRENALKIAKQRAKAETPTRWRVGVSIGSVVGELKKVDDLDADNLFVVVPPVGPPQVVCEFPSHLREEMGQHLFKIVRVTGRLHYGEESPFPFRVEATTIEQVKKRRKSMRELRGIFAGRDRAPNDWGPVLDGV